MLKRPSTGRIGSTKANSVAAQAFKCTGTSARNRFAASPATLPSMRTLRSATATRVTSQGNVCRRYAFKRASGCSAAWQSAASNNASAAAPVLEVVFVNVLFGEPHRLAQQDVVALDRHRAQSPRLELRVARLERPLLHRLGRVYRQVAQVHRVPQHDR